MLTISHLHRGWDLRAVFGDGQQWCPVCGSRDFVAVEPAGGLYCARCDARFSCRETAGDPGLVVDCQPHGYTPEGEFTGRGVHFWLDPPQFHQRRAVFWQVLKPCEGGLDDRRRWCSNYIGRGHFMEAITDPVGVELFFFRARDIAEHLLQRRWEKEHGLPPALDDRPTYVAYANRRHDWLWQRVEATVSALQRVGREGYYRREQCRRILADTGYVIPRCIPKPGEQPVI